MRVDQRAQLMGCLRRVSEAGGIDQGKRIVAERDLLHLCAGGTQPPCRQRRELGVEGALAPGTGENENSRFWHVTTP